MAWTDRLLKIRSGATRKHYLASQSCGPMPTASAVTDLAERLVV